MCKTEAGEPYRYCRLVMFTRVPHSSKGCWELFIAFSVGRKEQKRVKIYKIQIIYIKIYYLKKHFSLGQILSIALDEQHEDEHKVS